MKTMTQVDSMIPKDQSRAWIANRRKKITVLMEKMAIRLV